MRGRRVLATIGVVIGLWVLTETARAQGQAIDGLIEGVVRQQEAGTAVAGATVRAFNSGSGYERTVVTDASGRYVMPLMPPGEYVVFVEAATFASMSRTGLQLRAGRILTVEFTLPLASFAESVQVTADLPAAGEVAVALEKVGNQVQILASKQIAAGGYTNFAEIAQGLIRGANVGYSPDEGEFTIRLDGGGDRDTLVTIDGMPLWDRGAGIEDIWGATLIDPHMIERVEVFRGGQSLYFGSNAGIGLVSVITKKPDGTRKGEFGVSYGSFNTRDIWGHYSFPLDQAGNHSLMFYGSRQATHGPQLFSREAQVDNLLAAGGITDNNNARDSTGVKYRWQIGTTSSLNADVMYVETRFQDTFPNVLVYGPTLVKMPAIILQYNKKWSSLLSTDITASYRNPTLYNTKFSPSVCRNRAGCPQSGNPRVVTPWGNWTGELEQNGAGRGIGDESWPGGFEELVVAAVNRFTFNPSVTMVLGLQSTNYRDTSDPRIKLDDDLVSNNAIIADLLLNPPFSHNTSISVASRVDFEKSFGSETIGKFGLRHSFDGGLYVRANGGTSFSLPRTNELFFSSPTVVGNPDLKPEKTRALNYGMGFQGTMNGSRLAIDLGGFSTDISNRIQTTTGLTPNTRFNNKAVTEIWGSDRRRGVPAH